LTVSTDGYIRLFFWGGEILEKIKEIFTDARLTCVGCVVTKTLKRKAEKTDEKKKKKTTTRVKKEEE
jgi:hypothetical protein